jgi:predicted transposase/invertase (TIGR01784 family)
MAQHKEILKVYRDNYSVMETAKKEARNEGREEGRQEGRQEGQIEAKLKVAREMKKEGLSIDLIIKVTALPKEQIEKL